MSQQTQFRQIAKRGGGTGSATSHNPSIGVTGAHMNQPVSVVPLNLMASSSIESKLLSNVDASITQITAEALASCSANTAVHQKQAMLTQATTPFTANSSGQPASKGSGHAHQPSLDMQKPSAQTTQRKTELYLGSTPSAQYKTPSGKGMQKQTPSQPSSIGKTPQQTINLQNTDYYSVQSNGSSRNVSAVQGQSIGASGFKSKATSNSQIRQNLGASRNSAVPNQTMIKSSHIVVTPVTSKKAYLQHTDPRQCKNVMNQTVTQLFPTSQPAQQPVGSPNFKGKDSRLSITGSQTNLSVNNAAVSGGVSPVPAQLNTDQDRGLKGVTSRQLGSNEKLTHRFKATSQERLRQRQLSNDNGHQGLSLNYKLNQAYKATINQKLISTQMSRRTSTIGASPMALCPQHSKPPILSPNKSLLQNQVLASQKDRQANHSVSSISHYFPQPNEDKASVFQSKSVVLAAEPVTHQQQMHYSPKQSLGSQSIFKSPATQSQSQLLKKQTFQAPSHPIILGQGSPSMRLNSGSMTSKVATSRHSTGGGLGFSGQTMIIGEPVSTSKKSKFGASGSSSLTYQQTSRIIHSKVVKNLNNNSLYQNNQSLGLTPETCLKIDLNQITASTVGKKNSMIIPSTHSPSIHNDDYCDTVEVPFSLCGGEQEKKKGPGIQSISQAPIVQLNSPSPKSQFFSKSPKLSSSKPTGNSSIIQQSFPSSNRHSLIQHPPLTPVLNAQPIQSVPPTQTASSTQNTARQQTSGATFQLQTKSSLAKKGGVVPSKVAQETQQQMVQKSKTQRMMAKLNQPQPKLLSKVPVKSGEASTKKVSEQSKAEVSKQVFEIVPPPSILREPASTNQVIEVNLVIQQQQIIEESKQRDLTPARDHSADRPNADNEQDISPPKDSSVILPDDSAYFTATQSPDKPDPNQFPMANTQFIQMHKVSLDTQTIEELSNYPLIYFAGTIPQSKTDDDKQEAEPDQQESKASKYDDEDGYFKINIGDHLQYRYEIMKVLGKGSFAQVIQCRDHQILLTEGRERLVAIKITRNTELDHKFAQGEAKLLQFLMQHDPNDEFNIVRLHEEFVFREHHCFVFELLPRGDLFEHLKENGFQGFPLPVIRQYAHEILKTLVFLEQHRIIHCDLKPENILLVHDESGKSRIKVVDFGSGSFRGEQVYTYVQSRFYRAPEVILRLMPPPTSYTEKVDIWSLGCILAELYTGEPLFPGNNEQEQLELIMEICGIPQSDFIEKCRKKEHYFDVDYSPFLIEDEEQGILRIPESKRLEQVIKTQDANFIDFLKRCLEVDPDARIAASQAIEHAWIKTEPASGIRAEWARLDSLGDNSISQDDVYVGGRGLTAPDESESESEDRSLTMRGSDRDNNFLFIQEPSAEANMVHAQSNPHLMSVSSSQAAFINASSTLRGRREEDAESGVRGTQFEESPVREATFDKPKKSLAQLTQSSSQFSIKPRYIADIKENFIENLHLQEIEKNRNEVLSELGGGAEVIEVENVSKTPLEIDDIAQFKDVVRSKETVDTKFLLMPVLSAEDMPQSPLQTSHSHEKRRDRSQRKKEHQVEQTGGTPQKNSLVVQKSPQRDLEHMSHKDITKGIEVIGKYEIFREEEGKQAPNVRDSVTSGIAMEANIPPVNSHRDQTSLRLPQTLLSQDKQVTTPGSQGGAGIHTENTINKITVTFYQKRATNEHQSKALSSGPAQPKKK